LVVPAGQRDRLERVCRYALRPPVAIERLHLTDDGLVRLSLRQPWHDGTTDLVFTPIEFLERLAVLGARAARRADIWTRRAGVSPVRWPPAADSAHRGGGKARSGSAGPRPITDERAVGLLAGVLHCRELCLRDCGKKRLITFTSKNLITHCVNVA
jgi:hypothetical protein